MNQTKVTTIGTSYSIKAWATIRLITCYCCQPLSIQHKETSIGSAGLSFTYLCLSYLVCFKLDPTEALNLNHYATAKYTISRKELLQLILTEQNKILNARRTNSSPHTVDQCLRPSESTPSCCLYSAAPRTVEIVSVAKFSEIFIIYLSFWLSRSALFGIFSFL